MGIHTLGQLAALDKEQLAARSSEAIACEARKGKSHACELVRPPESFEKDLNSENELKQRALLFMLRRFLSNSQCGEHNLSGRQGTDAANHVRE